jgi:predicted dehydrogenase
MTYDVGFIGTGANPDDPGREGFAMAYRHASGYERLDECRLQACTDIVPENARRFADQFEIDLVYEDHLEMCRAAEPDIVSVCVPPAVHADIVRSVAQTDVVDAIHCEKPMATTWGDCEEMAEICRERDVQLTINHQRRFGGPFREAKLLLDDGAIGSLRRIEIAEDNLFDAGSHLFDLCGYFTDQAEPSWVLSQIEYSEPNLWFGAHNENQAIAQWRYTDGTFGVASTGPGQPLVECYLRLRGDEGSLEIGVDEGPVLRLTNPDHPSGKTIDTGGEDVHGPPSPGLIGGAKGRMLDRLPGFERSSGTPSYIERAIEDVVAGIDNDEPSELIADNALQSTELIFACWESARRRGRIDLPLDIDDNPLEEMVEEGMLPVSTDPSIQA